jgi:hypothetical protein
VFVTAVDIDIRNEERLGTTQITKDGSYRIFYTREQFVRQEKDSADLKVYVYKTSNEKNTPLATSKILFNAGPNATINLVVGGDGVKGPSEFAALSNMIMPLLGDLPPADIVDDDKHQDVSFLVGETGPEELKIRFFATAFQHQAHTNVRAEIFYGLFRENISTELKTLLNEDVEALTKALKAAVTFNIINAITDDEISKIVSQLHNLGLQSAVKTPDGPAPLW